MTASTAKGTQVTAIEGSPITPSDRGLQGRPETFIGHAAVATTSIDETADVVLVTPIPSDLRVTSVEIKCDDLDSHACPTLAVDIGLYYSGIGGNQKFEGNTSGTEIDVDAFASADTSLQAAKTVWTDVSTEAMNITSIGSEAWSIAGLSEDPGGMLYVGIKVTTVAATAAAGDIVIKVEGIK